jgi:3-hydroxyisobutyrate dehydrogenase-like beta-hydroxyacid dehydrogenase
MKIGIIGIGNMGRAIAINLLKAKHEVKVWNRSISKIDELISFGAIRVDNPQDAFSGDVLISFLSDDAALNEVFINQKLLEGASKNTIHVNMSTISVAFAQELSRLHQVNGIPYIAAPVFGRTEIAKAGNLNIIAGGDEKLIDKLTPIFEVIGQKTWFVGNDPAKANVVKIAGNYMIAVCIQSMAEISAMAFAYGIQTNDVLNIVNNSIFNIPVYKTYGSLISNKCYEPAAFRLALGLKDVNLALQAGGGANVPMPFAGVLRDQHLSAIAHGDADKDWAAFAEVVFRQAGLR